MENNTMKEFSLNIYGENDEIVKKYETNVVRWRFFKRAVEIQDEIKDKDDAQQLSAIIEFMKSIFIGLTDEEADNADAFDIINTFKQIVNKAKNIKVDNSKN